MSGKVITIIGGGASSVSMIHSLLNGIEKKNTKENLTIFMIEKRSGFGRGLAYSEDVTTNLLNTKAGFITPFTDRPGHFYQWLDENRTVWEDDFPDIDINQDAFLPRPLFGHYLSNMVQHLCSRALSLECRLIPVKDEAIRLSFSHDGHVVVSTKNNLSFSSDHVVVSCGNGGSLEYSALDGEKNFFSSPYPVKRTARNVPKDARVAIIGSRLSAIDTVLGLKKNGHTGKITLHSRTGALPSVRGSQGRYQPQYLTLEKVHAHLKKHNEIRLGDVITWVIQELAAAGENIKLSPDNLIANCTQPNPLDYLKSEIIKAKSPRLWQAVLYATNSIIDLVWASMPEEDKKKFWPYFSWWVTYRVSIPVENAIKMRDLLLNKEMAIIPGTVSIIKEKDSFIVKTQHETVVKNYEYDVVIAATGTPRNIKYLDNPLVQDMLEQKIATPNPFGGIDVTISSGNIINANGNIDERITVLGELTSGTFLFTSVLEINARHAADRAQNILAKLEKLNLPKEDKDQMRRVG
ncbi:FAD/NAD(P)-binding protein [Erwinia sp. BNK-24-b]|uniref:FAD/NAD(P)-binding protein n=1 Tax=unclassified Erwinia TaxID=2622719 RepID=UPI0039BF182C